MPGPQSDPVNIRIIDGKRITSHTGKTKKDKESGKHARRLRRRTVSGAWPPSHKEILEIRAKGQEA